MPFIKNLKLAFFDIDGTLIGPSGLISERTKAALTSLRKQGVKLALATGRPLFGALKIAREIEIDCPSLFSSGAVIANPRSETTLYEAALNTIQVKKCIEFAQNLGLYVELYSRDQYFIEKATAITAMHTEYLGIGPTCQDFNHVLRSQTINKIVTISNSPLLELQQNLLIEEMKDLVCLCSKGASHPEILFNNITSTAANRAKGFKLIIDELQVRPEDVVAFGDAISDLAFIQLAGLGVAMQAAPNELKTHANLITDSAENDGVAKVIEQIVAEM